MLHMFILTVLSRWSLFNLGLYVFSIIFPVFLSGTLKVSVGSSELKSHGYFPVTLIVRNIQIPICLSSILLLEQTSWIFPPLGFQSWVGSKYLFYDDYFNIFLLEAFKKKKKCGKKWSSTAHLENTFRAGVQLQAARIWQSYQHVGRQDISKSSDNISRCQRATPGSPTSNLQGDNIWMV